MMITEQDVNKREIYRYLGYGRGIPDESIRMLVDEVLQQMKEFDFDAELPIEKTSKCTRRNKCMYYDECFPYVEEEPDNSILHLATSKNKFKMYDDRQFCNGHRTVTEGKPFAYIINGDYQNEENLRLIIEARAEVGGNYLSGCITDANSLIQTINKFTYALENHYVKPRTFYGVGGMKIFRDLIWVMRGIMKADHVFYKKHGVYDFP